MSEIWECNVCGNKVPKMGQSIFQNLRNQNAREVVKEMGCLVIAIYNGDDEIIEEKMRKGMSEKDARKEFFREKNREEGLCDRCFPV